MREFVIHRCNLPLRPPVLFTVVSWLLLDRLDAGMLAWALVGVYVIFNWIVWGVSKTCVEMPLRLWAPMDEEIDLAAPVRRPINHIGSVSRN